MAPFTINAQDAETFSLHAEVNAPANVTDVSFGSSY